MSECIECMDSEESCFECDLLESVLSSEGYRASVDKEFERVFGGNKARVSVLT